MPRAPVWILIAGLVLALSWAAAPPAIAAPSTPARDPSGSEFLKRGLIAQKASRWEDAMWDFRRALIFFIRNNDEKNEAATLNNIALIHYLQGRYGKALEYYEKSMAIEKRLGNRAGMARSYNHIGEIHKSQGRYAKAMVIYEKSLEIEKQMGDRLGIAGTRLDMGIVAYRKGSLDIAIRHTEEALEVFRSLGSPHAETAEKNLRIFRQREWR